MNSIKPALPHKNNFDLLRLVFSSMVVFFHIGILTQMAEFSWFLRISATFAVQAFFIVSGYLVIMSCEKSYTLAEYGKKRLLRIAPAYIFVVICAAILLSLMSTLTFSEYFSSREFWRYIGMNLMLANFSAPSLPGVFAGQYENAVNVSLWTIKIEVLFYACAPMIVWTIRRWGYRKVLASIFVLSIIWMFGFHIVGIYTGNEFYLKLSKQLPGQMTFFSGGAWCYYATREGFRPSGWLAFFALIFYAFSGGWVYQLGAALAVTAIVSWAALSMRTMGNPGKHGDFSFGIYLYHVPIVQTVIALGYFSTYPGPALFITFLLVLLCAVLSWNFIEKPFLNHRKRAIVKSSRS